MTRTPHPYRTPARGPDGLRLELDATPDVRWDEELSPDGQWIARSVVSPVEAVDGILMSSDDYSQPGFDGFYLENLVTSERFRVTEALEESLYAYAAQRILGWSKDGRWAYAHRFGPVSDYCVAMDHSRDLVRVDLQEGSVFPMPGGRGEIVFDAARDAMAYAAVVAPDVWRIDLLELGSQELRASESFPAQKVIDLVWLRENPASAAESGRNRIAFTAVLGDCTMVTAVLVADLDSGEISVLREAERGMHRATGALDPATGEVIVESWAPKAWDRRSSD